MKLVGLSQIHIVFKFFYIGSYALFHPLTTFLFYIRCAFLKDKPKPIVRSRSFLCAYFHSSSHKAPLRGQLQAQDA